MRLRCDPGSGIIFQIIADIRRGQIVRLEMLNVSWSNTVAMTSWTWQCHIRALSDPSMLLKCHHLTSTLGEWMKRARIYRVPFPKSLCSISSAHWTGCWLAACIRRSLCSIWACTTVRPARDGLFTLDCSTVSWMQSKRSNLLDKYTVAWCQFLFSRWMWVPGVHTRFNEHVGNISLNSRSCCCALEPILWCFNNMEGDFPGPFGENNCLLCKNWIDIGNEPLSGTALHVGPNICMPTAMKVLNKKLWSMSEIVWNRQICLHRT